MRLSPPSAQSYAEAEKIDLAQSRWDAGKAKEQSIIDSGEWAEVGQPEAKCDERARSQK